MLFFGSFPFGGHFTQVKSLVVFRRCWPPCIRRASHALMGWWGAGGVAFWSLRGAPAHAHGRGGCLSSVHSVHRSSYSLLQLCSTAVGAAPALPWVQVGWPAPAPNHESGSGGCLPLCSPSWSSCLKWFGRLCQALGV